MKIRYLKSHAEKFENSQGGGRAHAGNGRWFVQAFSLPKVRDEKVKKDVSLAESYLMRHDVCAVQSRFKLASGVNLGRENLTAPVVKLRKAGRCRSSDRNRQKGEYQARRIILG